MDSDAQSQCSDEGVDLSILENIELSSSECIFMEECQPSYMEAKVVYLMMPHDKPLSRASRLQWLLDRINTIITPSHKLNKSFDNLEVISAIPREQNVTECNHFLITYRTEVKFLAYKYRFVCCIDMSPSHANVDIQKGEILFDEILNCFKACIDGLSKEFVVPGCPIVFEPCIYLTVIVNTPFFMSPAQQVLIEGVQVTQENLKEIIKYVESQFHLLEEKIADVSAAAFDSVGFQNVQNDDLLDDNFFDFSENNKLYSQVPMVAADINFVNMLRYSMLAISLLPENSMSHILVITDGIVAMPDSSIMESLLYQLHYDNTACSFLKVGSSFHPHGGAGFISYTDLLYFFAHSTLGTCLENFVFVKNEPFIHMNIYHELFLLWSFHSANKYAYSRICDNTIWTSLNDTFCSHKVPSLVSKKQTDDTTKASILLLLSRRMREGFTVDNIFYLNGNLEIKLILQWKSSIYIHYKVKSEWPISKLKTSFEIYVSAPYEFLHDFTCILKKEQKSLFRQAVIERFWMRLNRIQSDDLGLAQQLGLFQSSKDWYTLPESVRSGIPVFYFNNANCTEHNKRLLIPRDPTCQKFINIWQPVCQMETTNWRKWFHTHKVSLILKHDNPLPKFLHVTNSSQRFQTIQCRQAATALYSMLSDWASFVLIDSHTYLKFLYLESEKPPTGFCIVRVTSKFPCSVINIGFTMGIPGSIRYQICDELRNNVRSLSYLSSPLKVKDNFCCVLLQKPLEKILIRYERIPRSYTTVIFPDGTQPPHSPVNLPSPVSGSLFTTLSRYLFHKRWIWSATLPANPKLSDQSLARILNTLTKMRLKEGYSFVHSASGIITMVLELEMDPSSTCLVQYVLFPPHHTWVNDEIFSESDEDNEQSSETETEFQLVTEMWIEPQYGRVIARNPRISYIDKKYYHEIADMVSGIDLQCIRALLTMEHLSLMCQDKTQSRQYGSSPHLNHNHPQTIFKTSRRTSKNSHLDSSYLYEKGTTQWYPIISQRIEHIPFNFDPMNILYLCQQTELLFSMFIEVKEKRSMVHSTCDKANKLLLDNVIEHFGMLHDQELELDKDSSDQFTQEILSRHRSNSPHPCPLSESMLKDTIQGREAKPFVQWKCFVKGVSPTHVILTFITATLDDMKALMELSETSTPNLSESLEGIDRVSSRESNYSDVPINVSHALSMPIYVFDCPLARLINAFIYKNESSNEIIYEDHRFKYESFLNEETVRLKVDDSLEEPPDFKEEVESEKNCVQNHCKTLVLTHSKCFILSMFMALHMGVYIHNNDVQSAMDQCEESLMDIDITEYILTVCSHVNQTKSNEILLDDIKKQSPFELKELHKLIRDKFFKTINTVFYPIPKNREYYFYKNINHSEIIDDTNADSDDEVSENLSEVIDFKSTREFSIYSEGSQLLQKLEREGSLVNVTNSDVNPLFLHLVCTLKYDNGEIYKTSVRVIPTCLGELVQHLTTPKILEKSKIQVTLHMYFLTLPLEVQNIIKNYSTQGLRSTSFCSDIFYPSIGSTVSDSSYNSQVVEPLKYLSESQKKAICFMQDEIKWTLQNEVCTALLDLEPVTSETLISVMNHVSKSSEERASCILDTINLNFIYSSTQSYDRFEKEFANLHLPYSGYELQKVGDLYYLAKTSIEDNFVPYNKTKIVNIDFSEDITLLKGIIINQQSSDTIQPFEDVENSNEYLKEQDSQQSDISSMNESAASTDGGYDEDVSDDYEDYDWLITLNNKRPHLPNFWLILKLSEEVVNVHFHCRFLELATIHVRIYLEIQRAVSESVKELCKRINQMLLLQTLYETKICDALLEPDDSSDICSSPISRTESYSRSKSIEEPSDDFDLMAYSQSLSEASLNFRPGYFSCPVVWENHFILHPRLKTGPGKLGISRGILALKNILEKFSVSNRNNMFVYRGNDNNVFYLRLHENVQYTGNKTPIRNSEFENSTVSRSPSIASLPLGQKSNLTQSQQSIISVNSGDIRPRVRSFGEKESKDCPSGDTLLLRVHGINKAGSDVQQDLVQVLQNRLDDAVLEFLTVMLARNAMCPLTPEDVHFIQKPFRLPEVVIRLTIQDFTLRWLESFIHYLKQNLLLFLNIPKYTDNRSHYHFKDYTENDDGSHTFYKDNIFIYNQSQNPSSGSRGISCISLALVNNLNSVTEEQSVDLANIFESMEFEKIVSSEVISDKENYPDFYLEFRLWNQGRVNIENLSEKLKSAVSQATWDIIMEYYLLKEPLCVENLSFVEKKVTTPVKISHVEFDFNKEIEFNCVLDYCEKNVNERVTPSERPKLDYFLPKKKKVMASQKTARAIMFEDVEREKPAKRIINLNKYEMGDVGKLSIIYAKYLPLWLGFGHNLNTPSIRKHRISLTNKHLSNTSLSNITELLSIFPDSVKAFRCISNNSLKNKSGDTYVPFISTSSFNKFIIICRNLEQWYSTITTQDHTSDFPDLIHPNMLKHSQKFVPTICNNTFIPRQKFLWISVDNESILLYTYNWAKDNIDKLITNCTNLGYWLSVRSCFFHSVTSQKLGLYHNQPLTRKAFMIPSNPYSNIIGNCDYMINFPKDHQQKISSPAYNITTTLEAFRDHNKIVKYSVSDAAYIFTQELQDIKSKAKYQREEMKLLHGMYQSRTSTVTVSQLKLLINNARVVHFCHTPLLFLPRWRYITASTRRPSLYPAQAIQMTDKLAPEDTELLHKELCYSFFLEYRHYLQSLGFIALQIDNPGNNLGTWTADKSYYNNVFFMQKTILGGILIFTAEFSEPFFSTKIFAIECSRLQNISSRASINRFTLSFLDECDRIKILIHLHSFTFDYHLRWIFNNISENPTLTKVCDRYNINQFLDDFIKYYNKAPNFAQNSIYCGTLTLRNLVVQGQQLYQYLLTNINQYDFKVFEMDMRENESEYILVRITSEPQVSYKDSLDQQHTDDYDITLIVYNLCAPYSPSDNVLHLRYYLLLTSKRETYPKSEVEEKLGKFRTVSSTSRSLTKKKETSDNESSLTKSWRDQELTNSRNDELLKSQNDLTNSSSDHMSLPEINQESVNYLGYYSSHEQMMQQIILEKAHATQNYIKDMVEKGMVHCRTHLLWNRLISPQDCSNLTYEEFMELKSLAKLEHLCKMHPNLESLLNQPLGWYQGLAKLLLVKYVDHNRSFFSPDGNIQHYVILDQRYFGAFMLLSVDLHTSRGDLYAVYREPQKQEDTDLCLAYQKSLLDGFINCICFYLWSGMI